MSFHILCAQGRSVARDTRKDVRQAVNITCWLRNDTASKFIEARIRNISSGGVQVIVSAPTEISDTVDLYMTRDGKIARRCHVAWRRADIVGLKFVAKKTADLTHQRGIRFW